MLRWPIGTFHPRHILSIWGLVWGDLMPVVSTGYHPVLLRAPGITQPCTHFSKWWPKKANTEESMRKVRLGERKTRKTRRKSKVSRGREGIW